MAALSVDLRWRVGDTFTGPTWAVVVDGAAVDLTDGWIVRAQARKRPQSAEVLMEWSTTNGRVTLGTAVITRPGGVMVTTSTVTLTHTAAASAVVAPFTGRYDCEISRAGITHTITEGAARADQDVTR